jgi:hypothetical protein
MPHSGVSMEGSMKNPSVIINKEQNLAEVSVELKEGAVFKIQHSRGGINITEPKPRKRAKRPAVEKPMSNDTLLKEFGKMLDKYNEKQEINNQKAIQTMAQAVAQAM